ncbi:chloride channel protein [Xanthomonas cassavae CFBP 4642]|uniref:Chloride channel protein n=3 Tax=Xanthomonas cassavae TaxID=56450 RepID=A0ABS8HB41_9XANT|nr:chloride channel protein [Xanthomonas cassavae]MCC4618561.1 chloride channel protein [Xanthomonas cassavae CFBP 4642]
MPAQFRPLDRRVPWIASLSLMLAFVVAGVAQLLTALIGLVTNLAYFGRLDVEMVSPAEHALGAWAIAVPVVGGVIVGVMARYGSGAIRGHGIPEAMEQVLRNDSRIPPIMTWLKPTSSAVAIGTGGPFGAEGPIIATGGALGSLLGQRLHVTADERKTLLAAGAAAGMAAIFATPIAAVVLAVELLLFERRARSLIPVALAAMVGAAMHGVFEGAGPVFPMPMLPPAVLSALFAYVAMGAVVGAISVGVTRLTYGIEDAFERIPLHWMWWPAIGGVVIGVVGYWVPRTLGVGYDNIILVLGGGVGLGTMLILCVAKLVSWSVALGSGTSGGTLAPLFTIGGALGGVLGVAVATYAPWLGVDPRMAALVCMAAMFAGASRAFLASVLFAFEATQQTHGLLPLLGGCAAAYLVSGLMMRHTIMTEKIVRRGVRVPSDYSADHLDQIAVGTVCSRDVVSLEATQTLGEVRQWLRGGGAEVSHQGFPVTGPEGLLQGVLTRRELLDQRKTDDMPLAALLQRAAVVIGEQHSLREAADHMSDAGVGRLVVVDGQQTLRVVGIITRSDLLAAHGSRLQAAREIVRTSARRSIQAKTAQAIPEA